MRQLINRLLDPLGFRLLDLRKFGRDSARDIQTLLRTTPTPVCFDIGAHRGETLQRMVRQFPRAIVHAFEPDPENFAALEEIAKNVPQARLHRLAMGDRPQQSKLFKTQLSQCNSLLSAAADLKSDAHQKIGEVDITVSTVDEFCEKNQIGTVDFLKTDCQGLDLRVLKGATKMLSERRVQVIQCESMFTLEYEGQGWFYEILKHLTEVGYLPVSFGEPARNARYEIIFSDVIFRRRAPA